MSQPTATRTFVFTDIEGSTRRWQADEAGMSAALMRHDALVRSAIESHGGQVFKTVGDAFYAAFEHAPDGVAAAVALQLALAAEDWAASGVAVAPLRVRAAVHVGEAEARGGDWYGRSLNRVARLLAVGHGGQVLLSGTAEALVVDALPPGIALRDLGRHRLKDLLDPEQVFQVLAPGLVSEFPALDSVGGHPNNLPAQPSALFGREADVASVRALLAAHRLVTLTGIGGTGKTRLALQVATEALEDRPDGAWFVDLSPLADPALVVQATAMALGLREDSGRSLEDTLVEHLAERRLLLVLDNCEHVLEEASRLADTLLRQAPGVRILATSRELLAAPGEHTWAVPPLEVPALPGASTAPEELAQMTQVASVRLFAERAAAHRPEFRLTLDNAAAVAGICNRLEGVPLALELAAARVRHLDPRAILHRLDDRFRLLTTGSRTAPSRQQTLRAALDWSHDLLDGPERALLRRLAVFRGGWTLAAAEAVCADQADETGCGLPADAVLDVLGRLVDKSLALVREGDDGGSRYGFLETIRQYARERLEEAGETSRLETRHLAHFEVLSDETERHRNASDSAAWLDRIDAEVDNLRAALDRVAAGDLPPELGFRLAGRLWSPWSVRRASSDELVTRAKALLARHAGAVSVNAHAMVAYAAGNAAGKAGRREDSITYRKEAFDLARACGDERLEAWCLNDLANFAASRGELVDAERHLLASLAIKEKLGLDWEVASSLKNLGWIASGAGDVEAMYGWMNRSVAAARRAGSKGVLSGALADLAYFMAMDGRLDEARLAVDEACRLAEASGDYRRQADAFEHAGLVALMDGRLAAARESWLRAMRRALLLRQHRMALLVHFARLAVRDGDHDRAARLAGASGMDRSPVTIFGPHPRERADREADLTHARATLGEVAWDRAFGEGQAMKGEESFLYALAMPAEQGESVTAGLAMDGI